MKSKLFLSLSLLTAVFSVIGSDNIETNIVSDNIPTLTGKQLTDARNAKFPKIDFRTKTGDKLITKSNVEFAQKDIPTKTGAELMKERKDLREDLFGLTESLLDDSAEASSEASKEASKVSYFQSFKDGIASGWNKLTVDNMKFGVNKVAELAVANPYHTGAIVLSTAAFAYGAYKLYNSNLFAKRAQKEAPKAEQKPVAVRTVKPVRNPYSR